VLAGRAEAAAGMPFLPHQALYDLSLVKSRGSNAAAANGGGRGERHLWQ